MPTPLAELDGATVRRAVDDTILGPLTAAIEPGITGIIGRSGAGKSTLLRLLAGRLPARWGQDGRLWFRGRRVRAGEPVPGAALAPQYAQSGLDPRMPVGRLLAWAARGDENRVHEVLEELGLAPDAILPQRPTTLSGGMRQRVLLAVALLRAQALLMLDEPTSALDRANGSRVLAAAARWRAEREQRAVLAVSHDLELLRGVADRLWVFERGRLVETVEAPWSPFGLGSRAGRAHAAALARVGRLPCSGSNG